MGVKWLGATTVVPKGTTGSCYSACELACMQETGGVYVPYVTTLCAAQCYDASGCAQLPQTGFEWLPTDTITPPATPPPTTPPPTKPPATPPPPSSTAKDAFAPTKTLMDVVPAVRPKFEALLAYASSLGLKPVIRSAGRTCAEQNAQKEAGYSQAAMCRSMHTLGHAIDIDVVPSTCANYTKLGEWWEKQGGVWGGRWTQFGPCGDSGHFQYGFDGAGAVPTTVCPEGVSLAQCEKLRSEYLTKAMAQAPARKGGGVLTSLIIIGVGVGFVWATLRVKPGRTKK